MNVTHPSPKLQNDLSEKGYTTFPFPDHLRHLMLSHIEQFIRQLGAPKEQESLDNVVSSISDQIWSQKMTRAFRIFPKEISKQIHSWAHQNFCENLGAVDSSINAVYPQEAVTNSALTPEDIAIYWRCVRPEKPDAGRPHRDASFWELEFGEGYDPKIPFRFNHLTDCIKIWIPLKGCIPTTTLQVVPFSHREHIETIVESTEYGRRPNISPDWLQARENDFMSPPELSQGSCILFDMNLVHCGPKHENDELRISAELNFILKRAR